MPRFLTQSPPNTVVHSGKGEADMKRDAAPPEAPPMLALRQGE